MVVLVGLMMLAMVLSSLAPPRTRDQRQGGVIVPQQIDGSLVFDRLDAVPSEVTHPPEPQEPPDPSDPSQLRQAAPIHRAVDAARRRLGLSRLDTDPRLTAAAERGVEATVRQLMRDPLTLTGPEKLDLQKTGRSLPEALALIAESVAANESASLPAKVAECSVVGRPELTHLGVGLAPATRADGRVIWFALLLGARFVPEICPDSVTAGQGPVFVRCFHCQATMFVRLEKRPEREAGGLQIVCVDCDRVCDQFAAGTDRRYRRPPWFLKGYQPRSIRNPLDAWLTVLTRVRYADDFQRFGWGEIWQTAEETYRMRQGDCEDSAILLADWLTASGYKARVATGQHQGGGHAWVVVWAGGHSYVLEPTGGRGNYRRVPPRASISTDYVPASQFDRTGIWFRTSPDWTAEYDNDSQWKRRPAR